MSHDEHAATPSVAVGGMPTRSGSVTRTLLLAAVIGTALMALAYQFGVGDTTFNRPGELALLVIDVAPLIWFAAATVLLWALRWQSIDQRFRWVAVAAVGAVLIALTLRLTIAGEGWVTAVLEPFTLGFLVVVAAAIAYTRTRVRRLARGTEAGITLTALGWGVAVVSAGVALGSLRVAVAGSVDPLGSLSRDPAVDPTTGLLTAASLLMVAGLFWLTDRTRHGRS